MARLKICVILPFAPRPFLNKKQLEQLILAGALDSLHPNRAEAFYALETILSFGQAEAAERNQPKKICF